MDQPQTRQKSIMSIIFFIFGIIFAAFGILFFYSEWRFYKKAFRVEGSIVSVKEGKSATSIERLESNSPVYYTVIEFEFDGMKRQITHTYEEIFKPQVGKKVTVAINPKDYREVKVHSLQNRWVALVFALMGIIIIGIAYYSAQQ